MVRAFRTHFMTFLNDFHYSWAIQMEKSFRVKSFKWLKTICTSILAGNLIAFARDQNGMDSE